MSDKNMNPVKSPLICLYSIMTGLPFAVEIVADSSLFFPHYTSFFAHFPVWSCPDINIATDLIIDTPVKISVEFAELFL